MTMLLLPFSWLYALAVFVRNLCYDIGVLPVTKVDVPVIAVGNMTSGGTGKTPFVEYLVHYVLDHHKRVAVVSRGYGRSTRGTFIVSDGTERYGTAVQTGDEPFQIANKFRQVVIVADENRVRGARVALNRFHPDVIILDDGFQHRALSRNLDIVMIDGTTPLDMVPLLPAGIRREPFSSLGRAHLIALSRMEISPLMKQMIGKYSSAPIINVRFVPTVLRELTSDRIIQISEVKNKRCVAFCGIGNPESFKNTLESTGLQVMDLITYPDHYFYTTSDIRLILDTVRQQHAEMIITTEKDAARLTPDLLREVAPSDVLCRMIIEAVVMEGKSVLHALLDATMQGVAA